MKANLLICFTIFVSLQLASMASANSHQYGHDSSSGVKIVREGVNIESTAEKIREIEHRKSFPVKTFEAFADFISQPAKLVVYICKLFELPIKRVIEFVGKSIVVGKEAISRPVVCSFKIIEKIFVPDACLLRKLCEFGQHLTFARRQVVEFSPKALRGSDIIKALTDGIIGQDCNIVYDNCELALKPRVELLREEKEKIVVKEEQKEKYHHHKQSEKSYAEKENHKHQQNGYSEKYQQQSKQAKKGEVYSQNNREVNKEYKSNQQPSGKY